MKYPSALISLWVSSCLRAATCTSVALEDVFASDLDCTQTPCILFTSWHLQAGPNFRGQLLLSWLCQKGPSEPKILKRAALSALRPMSCPTTNTSRVQPAREPFPSPKNLANQNSVYASSGLHRGPHGECRCDHCNYNLCCTCMCLLSVLSG